MRPESSSPGKAWWPLPYALARGFLQALVVLLGLTPAAAAETDEGIGAQSVAEKRLLAPFKYRNLGPFRAGSWVTDIAVPRAPTGRPGYTFYVAARNGGVWKTVNNGTTFRNVTDSVGISSVGDLAVAPSNPEVVWVGTGDAENARSSYSGTGVYRSLDGGENWNHVGLSDSHHIARILIHPRDPLTVYVASMGHLFSENEERGVFKTTDGGRSWRKVLYLGPGVGVIDLVMHPEDPGVLYAAAYEKKRYPWSFVPGGEASGLYRTANGGDSWSRLEGGLPKGTLGRIGVDLCRAEPSVLYAVIENLEERPPTAEEMEADRRRPGTPQPRPLGNQVWRTDDGGQRWRRVSADGLSVGNKSAYAFNEVRVDPIDPERLYITSDPLISSIDGGKSWRDLKWPPSELFATMFGDVRTLWIDPQDPEHLILGSDGGVFLSYDGGRTNDHLANLPLGEVYQVTADLEDPYNLYVGLQDHEAWRGPVNGWSGGVGLEDWVIVGRWDGMYSQVDPSGRWYYATTQFGNHLRADLTTGRRVDIQPHRPSVEAEAASLPPSEDAEIAKPPEPEGSAEPYRFTWTTPLVISPHDPQVLYTGAQVVLRSSDRGDTWRELSPDLTTNDPTKASSDGAVRYSAVTTLAESPVRPGVIWAGTDDGKVWVTRDLGERWLERTSELSAAGAPADVWVSRVTPSAHATGRVYVSKSGYRRDDFRPYLFRSDDFGATWSSISDSLPAAPISVVIEDRVNPDLLFVGNDQGVYVSLDRGESWTPFKSNMPRVPVRDLYIQPREQDLIVGTYGRGVWITGIHPLQQLDRSTVSGGIRLFPIESRPVQLSERPEWGAYRLYGDRHLVVENEPDGLEVYYYLPEEASEASLTVETIDGTQLTVLEAESSPGLHRALWRTRLAADVEQVGVEELEGETVHAVLPGEYTLVLQVDGEVRRRRGRLREVPDQPLTSRARR